MSHQACEWILGASGQIGHHLLREASATGASAVVGTYCRTPAPGLTQLDLTSEAQIDALLAAAPPAVIHWPAFNPAVDEVERHPEATRLVNVEAPRRLLDRLRGSAVKIVYYSTDYVFDGAAGPYGEDDEPMPLSEYGRQKLEIEHAVMGMFPTALVLRTTVVFSHEPQGKNFVQRAVAALRRGEVIRQPLDQFATPTYAPALAKAARQLVAAGATGVVHVAGPDFMSRVEFAEIMAEVFGFSPQRIVGVTTADLHQPAKRPLLGGLKTDRLARLLGHRLPSARQGLEAMRKAWEEAEAGSPPVSAQG